LNPDYKWKIDIQKYTKGTFLLGMNFNTNDDYGKENREYYLCIYLGKFSLVIGKYN